MNDGRQLCVFLRCIPILPWPDSNVLFHPASSAFSVPNPRFPVKPIFLLFSPQRDSRANLTTGDPRIYEAILLTKNETNYEISQLCSCVYRSTLTSSRALVWSILRLRHLAAAILFLSRRICRLSSSSGVIPTVLVGLLPPMLRLTGCCCCGCVCCWLSMRVVVVGAGRCAAVVFCVCAGVGCDGSTSGGTKPASRPCVVADSLVSSRNVCSMLRRVVGVNVGVVLVGTPLCNPSKDTSCNIQITKVLIEENI